MSVKEYKAAVGLRGDCLYCPLSLTIDSYWNCLVNCHHCYFRRLNRTWGGDLRAANPDHVLRKLSNGLKTTHPQSSLAYALKNKLTIRVGNKTDPYQPIEDKHGITRQILKGLIKLNWTFAIQTRFLSNLQRDEDLLEQVHKKGLLTLIPIIRPGAERDWEILEKGRTTPILERFRILEKYIRKGWNVGVNGEPFIPGYHTVAQFRDMLKRLVSIGVRSYNIYNLHLNDYVAKNLHGIGLDIRKIWIMNQDHNWKVVLSLLLQVSKEYPIIIGCPDFVNSGPLWVEKANTCCGVNVPKPSTFTTHSWKRLLQLGVKPNRVLERTNQNVGDKKLAYDIVHGIPCKMFTMRDAGLIK